MIHSVREMGQRALLIEVTAEKDRPSLLAHLAEHPFTGQLDAIPGVKTVLVDFRRRRDAQAALKQAKRLKLRRRRSGAADGPARRDAAGKDPAGTYATAENTAREQTGDARPEVTIPQSYAEGLRLEEREAVLEVLPAAACQEPGQTLVQDMGRYGFGGLGVGRAGPADFSAARQANRLIGNDDSAAVLEICGGGLSVRLCQTSILAVTGAEVSLEIITQEPVPTSRGGTEVAQTTERSRTAPGRAPFWVFPGEVLHLGPPQRGVYSYLGISGGLEAPVVLGSASTDTVAGLGPAPVQVGDRFALAGAASRFVGIASVAPTPLPLPQETTVLRYVPGPRVEYFGTRRAGAAGLSRLEGQPWEVMTGSSRASLVLDGDDPLTRTHPDALPAEPLMRGAISIAESGQPIVALAEHPVTSSDPVLGVVVREDLSLAAQLSPGAEVRFQAVDPETLGALSTR
ncbi:biotin-dependent carboxyltransferase family protein [Nesterenkonia sp. DZ6]|uniref:5-oxoprolinase subunit C family protein n=1 Tax=Nesterenkonia sp. DZ6 TaxID=2901229 RepID=UPI001F4CD4D0|nr:biotin-dependent carboxyltransferase family protein [Nesterenkonia sp. DZ6]MCH8560422.1 biotin-dependent carboxyltransferase family protein [Nesterenkonia sp. DZ6]